MARREKVFLYISDIASYIGQNKWDYITPFERLWKRCDKFGYSYVLNKCKNEINENSIEVNKLNQELVILDEDLHNKKITKRQHTLSRKNILTKLEKITDIINNFQKNIDDIDLNQQQKLEKVIGKSVINEIQNSNTDTNDKKDSVNKILEGMNIPKEKLNSIKQHADSFINKSHGTLKENDAIDMYQNKYNVKLDISQEFYKKQLNIQDSKYEWYICGKMDGIYRDPESPENNYVVEIKNRTKNFFSSLRDYEKTQIQLYIWILNYNKARLVEKHNDKLRVTSIYKEDEYISDILEHLCIFITNFEGRFLNNDEYKFQYIKSDNENKQLFLKKLYLNDISKCIRDKMDIEDPHVDCMIDDLD